MRPCSLWLSLTLAVSVAHAGVTWDFETGDLQGWQPVQGDLGTQPANRDDDRYGGNFSKQGKWFVGTYESGGDGVQGELRSPVFTITCDQIALLVGGGNHPDETFVALVLAEGDQQVRRATGHNTEAMDEVVWDVAAWKGQKAYARLVDHHSGGWGHINLDCVRELTPEEVAAARQRERERKEAASRHTREWKAALMRPAERTVDRGDALKKLTMTLGGIGAGNVALCGDGALRGWQLSNHVNAGAFVPYGFLGVRAQAEGQAPVTRVLQTAGGYGYDGPAGVLKFAPQVQAANLRAFFGGAEGWGTFAQTRAADTQTNSLILAYGTLALRRLELALPEGWRSPTAQVTLGDTSVKVQTRAVDQTLQVRFFGRLRLQAGEGLTVRIRARP
ncbi:MAG: hypothetical protein KKI08_08560 [Armatimonadetes bacterium]|nr:hypothetical protein [Armatimonadota bacterium]